MSLDIGIREPHSYSFIQGEPRLALEDDGYYWFLYPLFEKLAKTTGELIDLYGRAVFQAGSLEALQQTLSTAKALIEAQPTTWQVQVALLGPASSIRCRIPGRSGLHQQVERGQFINLLAQFQRILERARELGLPVVCSGD